MSTPERNPRFTMKWKPGKAAKRLAKARSTIGDEQIAFLGVCNNLRPLADIIVLTERRFLALSGDQVKYSAALDNITQLVSSPGKETIEVICADGAGMKAKMVPAADHVVLLELFEQLRGEPSGTPASTAEPLAGPVAGSTSQTSQSRREVKRHLRSGLDAVVADAVAGNDEALRGLPAALERARPAFNTLTWFNRRAKLVGDAFAHAIVDDHLDEEEDARIARIQGVVGITDADLATWRPGLYEELLIARINADRPPTVEVPGFLAPAGESAHGEFRVSLLGEKSTRVSSGSGSGMSIPIGFGISFSAGSYGGTSTTVTSTVVADTGRLVVTNRRTLFLGEKKTLEFPHRKLVSLRHTGDGLAFGTSGRSTNAVFRFRGGSVGVAAALVVWGTRTAHSS